MSRRAVQDAAARLQARDRAGITDVPAYRLRRPWLRGR